MWCRKTVGSMSPSTRTRVDAERVLIRLGDEVACVVSMLHVLDVGRHRCLGQA